MCGCAQSLELGIEEASVAEWLKCLAFSFLALTSLIRNGLNQAPDSMWAVLEDLTWYNSTDEKGYIIIYFQLQTELYWQHGQCWWVCPSVEDGELETYLLTKTLIWLTSVVIKTGFLIYSLLYPWTKVGDT